MLLSGISSRGSGVKSMTVADQDRRARKFGHITRKSSDLGPGLEQTRRVAAADSKVLSQIENRRKVCALVAYRKTRESRVQQELLFQSAQDAARLSHMRYQGGPRII